MAFPNAARIFCIANQKGGVGHRPQPLSTSAAGLARVGQRVLVVDLDPQAMQRWARASTSVSSSCRSTTCCSSRPASPKRASPVQGGYDVLGANRELAGAEVELVALERRNERLRDALAVAAAEYDFVLIDCPPSLSLLTLNGCAARTA